MNTIHVYNNYKRCLFQPSGRKAINHTAGGTDLHHHGEQHVQGPAVSSLLHVTFGNEEHDNCLIASFDLLYASVLNVTNMNCLKKCTSCH